MARSGVLRWERRPDERPGELLEAALRVFAARGYRRTTLDEVAAAAGVTKGAIYHYFPNKQELLLGAIEHYQDRAFTRLEEAMREASGPASARLTLLFRRMFGGVDEARRDVLTLLQGVNHEVPEAYRRWIANGPLEAWQLVAALIAEGQAAGEFRAEADAEVAARVVFTGIMGQLIWQRLDDVPGIRIGHERLVDRAVELLLAGLRS